MNSNGQFRQAIADFRNALLPREARLLAAQLITQLACQGSELACETLSEVFAFDPVLFDAEQAYVWAVALARLENRFCEWCNIHDDVDVAYSGEFGDFRNEALPNELIDQLTPGKARKLERVRMSRLRGES